MLGCVQVKEACPDQGWHAESWRHETTQSESAEVRESMIEQEQEWERCLITFHLLPSCTLFVKVSIILL